MQRREFIALAGGAAAAWPLQAVAQQTADVPQLCVLAADSLSSPWASRYAGFIKGLGDLGYVEGHNISINFLSADGKYERFPALAAECVRRAPVIIVAYTTPGSLSRQKGNQHDPDRHGANWRPRG